MNKYCILIYLSAKRSPGEKKLKVPPTPTPDGLPGVKEMRGGFLMVGKKPVTLISLLL